MEIRTIREVFMIQTSKSGILEMKKDVELEIFFCMSGILVKLHKFYLLTYFISFIITEYIRFMKNLQCKKKEGEEVFSKKLQ